MAGEAEMNRALAAENFEPSSVGGRRSREESRSFGDEVGSGDGVDTADKPCSSKKQKKYHRHTPEQIKELETLFKECPNPDEKQRLALSKKLKLKTRQVKFWFQNRRTQTKTHIERHENKVLKNENDRLRAENMSLRDALRSPSCNRCGGAAVMGELSIEDQHMSIENARLREELDRIHALTGKSFGTAPSSVVPPMPNSILELRVGRNGFEGLNLTPSTLPLGAPNFGVGPSNPMPILAKTMSMNGGSLTGSSLERRSTFLELALVAMDEMLKKAQCDQPLWVRNVEVGEEVLNHDEYLRNFTHCIGMKPNGFVTEASRESGNVFINSSALVKTLMDSKKWQNMFPDIVARTTTTDVLIRGMAGTLDGALLLMRAELQVLTPFVPTRKVRFLRYCKQHAESVWAVVDVSIDTMQGNSGSGSAFPGCRRLPSGCLVQDTPNGYSKVIWVEHSEYDESVVHQLYKNLISSGLGFGAKRWIAALQRQSECLAILMSSGALLPNDQSGITAAARQSILKLAQRMTNKFFAGVSASTMDKWTKLDTDNMDKGIRVMTRQSMDRTGEPPGIVLCGATSVWLPAPPQPIFDFLRNVGFRSEWDILSNGGLMQEMLHIPKGQGHGNSISLLRSTAMNTDQNMLVLQETCIDAAGALVVYAPVDIQAMQLVMDGTDSTYVVLLPSGFSIVPDGSSSYGQSSNGPTSNGGPGHGFGGSLVSISFQILVTSLPSGKLTLDSVNTASSLISDTVKKIKESVLCES